MSKTKKVEKVEEVVVVETKPLANVNGKYVEENTKIEWLIKDNPKRPSGKAHARFAAYMPAKTVGEYLALGGTTADLKYDQSKGFLEIK